MLLVSAALDALNCRKLFNLGNLKSLIYELLILSKLLNKNNILDENESILYSFAESYFRAEKLKIDDFVDSKIILEFTPNSQFKNIIKIGQNFRANGSQYSLKFHCDDLGQFYIIRDEIFF